jgi:hypothetical protein
MLAETITIAVASDLHAIDSHNGDDAPSHLRITDPEDQLGKNPITDLLHLISEKELTAELLLCPGDLGHQAKPVALKYAWQALQKVKGALKAESLIATSGNHDLDSRYIYNSYDAKGILQSLSPSYPLDNEDLNDKYWARNFVTVEKENYNLVILNSSAYHGTAPDEYVHGRVADSTLSALERGLTALPKHHANILLCHHHPQMHMELDLGDYDTMTNGQLLIDLLGRGSFGRWLLIHGHKHHPKLTYASGGATSPVIFSAGSLSASLYSALGAKVRNQFYILNLHLTQRLGLGLAGIIRAWDWTPTIGWLPAGSRSGLPPLCGFGFRGDPADLSERIKETIEPSEKATWDHVRSKVPEVDYVLPQDFQILRQELETRGYLVQDLNGMPHEIGRKV